MLDRGGMEGGLDAMLPTRECDRRSGTDEDAQSGPPPLLYSLPR
jgi:hypothetical protein